MTQEDKTFCQVQIKVQHRDELRKIAERQHRSMAAQIAYWIEQETIKSLNQREAS